MWLLEFLFFMITILIAWMLFGYFVFMWIIGLFRDKSNGELPKEWPKLSIVVPCYNEAHIILAKLEDIRQLDYPQDKLEVIFVDGGSADNTVDLLRKAIKPSEPYRVEISSAKGKINQLNHVLRQLTGDIVVNTDADALLAKDAIKWLVFEFTRSADVWVAGAYCHPLNAIDIEKYFWVAHNKCRFIETDAMSSSIVAAPCYAFRRGLLSSFPDDVVADDIYVALYASAQGLRVVQSRKALAFEARGPENIFEFLPHKFRKSNAFLRECLRFIHRLPQMSWLIKNMLITRTSQQLLFPWALILWLSLAWTLIVMSRLDLVVITIIFLIFNASIAKLVFSTIDLPGNEKKPSLTTLITCNLLTLAILLATGLSYPWFRQDSSYARIAPNKS